MNRWYPNGKVPTTAHVVSDMIANPKSAKDILDEYVTGPLWIRRTKRVNVALCRRGYVLRGRRLTRVTADRGYLA